MRINLSDLICKTDEREWHYNYVLFRKKKTFVFLCLIWILLNLQMRQIILPDPLIINDRHIVMDLVRWFTYFWFFFMKFIPKQMAGLKSLSILRIRGGVLEDRFWSLWPWPQSLKSLKIALYSARRQHYFLNRWNFVGKRQKPCRKFAKTIFCFPQVEIARKKILKIFFAWKKFLKTFFFEIAWKMFLKTFFFFGEHLRLCPWFLALVSRGSVLGLGLEIFLCPWPWPRALSPRLHLC